MCGGGLSYMSFLFVYVEGEYMGFVELFLIGVGLSMDAFAVAVCKGLCMKRFRKDHAFVIALFFGSFQGLMPLLGWFLGSRFASYIQEFDHWIAFFLLLWIGGNMIRESRETGDECAACGLERLNYKELLMMAIATSIDALAVGITFAFLSVKILPAVSLIGVTTLVLSFVGVAVGNYFGSKYKSKAELMGGLILIAIGTKILLEHLGVIS